MKNIITVIYPHEKVFSFVIENATVKDSQDNRQQLLERVFDEWNGGSGKESEQFIASKMRSLSVSDFVAVNGRYFQCASIGWNEVTTEYVNAVEQLVAAHPSRSLFGAYYALNQVMWDLKKKTIDNLAAV